MVLIFCEADDLTARDVLRKLKILNYEFVVFSERDTIQFEVSIENSLLNTKVLKNNSFLCYLENIDSIWFRRQDVMVPKLDVLGAEFKDLTGYSKQHSLDQVNYIRTKLNQKKCLGTFGKANFNKIEFLEACVSLNILTPKTLISRNKLDIIDFINSNRNGTIVKSLAFPFYKERTQEHGMTKFIGFTSEITVDDVNNCNDTMDISIFQEKLEKYVELRVIYLDGESFCECVFSQLTDESVLDMRLGLGFNSKMKTCSFDLPQQIKDDIVDLMNKINLNFGAIDIILTTDMDYVFIEVNPNGQIDATCDNIGLNIADRITNFLIK